MLKKITVLLGSLCLSTIAAAIPAPPQTIEKLFNNGWEHITAPDEHWSKTINDNGRLLLIQIFVSGKRILLVAGFTCGLNTSTVSYIAWHPQEKFGRRMTCDQKIIPRVEIPDAWNKAAGALPFAVEQKLREADEE